ncbi:MAG: CHAP domain-containing protein, partial [Acidimicrobiales bacterium]
RRRAKYRRRRLGVLVLLGTAAVLLRPTSVARLLPSGLRAVVHPSGSSSTVAEALRRDVTMAASISALRGRIVQTAESQLGYQTSPPNTYCNKYSAYWVSGNSDCGNANMDEEWCADFAAWVWQTAGAPVVYQYINGDLNSSSASFYEWGTARGTWHAVGTGYVPLPGDVVVYGLDEPALVAQHVAIVIGFTTGDRGPDTINGDGDHTGFSDVEIGNDQYQAHVPGQSPAGISGYVSPV